DRPLDAAYDRFAYLVKLFSDRNYHEGRIREECPFLVQDVLFNTLLCQSDRDLAEIARILGENPSPLEERAERTESAINGKLWDEQHGIYLDFDVASGLPLQVYVAANFVPLYAGIPDEGQAHSMVGSMENTGFGLSDESLTPVPNYDRYGFAFFPTRYWRGPVWVNINWFLMRVWNATASRGKPNACRTPSSPCAGSRASTSTMTPRPASGMARICSRGLRPCSWM
ncbi:MAG: alpha,alpha-trehalase, partial [Actinomycetota bacterium]|nr:alpha,alpha-trehalase [Actinomycetota bacterium]